MDSLPPRAAVVSDEHRRITSAFGTDAPSRLVPSGALVASAALVVSDGLVPGDGFALEAR